MPKSTRRTNPTAAVPAESASNAADPARAPRAAARGAGDRAPRSSPMPHCRRMRRPKEARAAAERALPIAAAPRPPADLPTFWGLDVGDLRFAYCALDAAGRKLAEGELEVAAADFAALAAFAPGAHAVLEAGARSAWIQRRLAALGWKVVVTAADTLSTLRRRKSDRVDAADLAELLRTGGTYLRPVQHKPPELLPLAFLVKQHVALMRVRTQLGSVAQGLCKELGLAIPKHTSANLAERLRGVVPPAMREIFRPLLGAMADVQKRLAAADTALARRAPRDTPQAARFAQQVPSVGILTAAAFVVAVHDPRRFDRARDAGAYFGLEPKERASGAHDPRLGITKAGNKTVRWLLVQAAHGLLKTNGTDCALRDAGLRLLRREGPGARQRAAVAVARKLAVLLVALWKSGEDFRPHPAADTPPAPAA